MSLCRIGQERGRGEGTSEQERAREIWKVNVNDLGRRGPRAMSDGTLLTGEAVQKPGNSRRWREASSRGSNKISIGSFVSRCRRAEADERGEMLLSSTEW